MKPLSDFEKGVLAALETYSNVHRGSGQHSLVTTHLYEKARDILLETLGLNGRKYLVLFCSPRRAALLTAKLTPGSYRILTGEDAGLPLGVTVLVMRRGALPGGVPVQAGGGTTRLIAPEWVIWKRAPDRFEPGTPPIINVIAFVRALKQLRQTGGEIFPDPGPGEEPREQCTAHSILHRDELERYSGQDLLDELGKQMIGRDRLVPTAEGMSPYINFDNSASTSTFLPVWTAVRKTWRRSGDVHKEIIEEVRSICARMLGAPPSGYEVLFTCNTTEAINLAAESWGRDPAEGTEPVMLSTILEHSSNDLPWRPYSKDPLIRLSADRKGFLDLEQLEQILLAYNGEKRHGKKRITLVAVSGASNVLGSYNDLTAISRIVHRYGARLLVDAAQMVAHHRISMKESGIDYLAFSAHKVYAPFGTGVLVCRKGLLQFTPAEMDLIRSSGEDNPGGIAALGKSLILLERVGMDLIREKEQALTARVIQGLKQISGVRIFGIRSTDSPEFKKRGGVIVFELKGNNSIRVARELAQIGGIGVRYGCHCSHILVKHLLGVGRGLERFQRIMLRLLPGLELPGLVRVSLGIGNSDEEVDSLIRVLGMVAAGNRAARKNMKKEIDDYMRVSVLRVYS